MILPYYNKFMTLNINIYGSKFAQRGKESYRVKIEFNTRQINQLRYSQQYAYRESPCAKDCPQISFPFIFSSSKFNMTICTYSAEHKANKLETKKQLEHSPAALSISKAKPPKSQTVQFLLIISYYSYYIIGDKRRWFNKEAIGTSNSAR